jgi:hypothetical protein
MFYVFYGSQKEQQLLEQQLMGILRKYKKYLRLKEAFTHP